MSGSAENGSIAWSLIVGLLLGGLCLAAGLLVVGMGHGWELPFKYGVFSFLLYPLAIVRWRCIDTATPWARDVRISAAITVPILLLFVFIGGFRYVVLFAALPFYWLAGRVLGGRWSALFGDAVLLAIGIALSIAALIDHNSSTYAARSWPFQLYWLPTWLGWQVIAALALVRHLRERSR